MAMLDRYLWEDGDEVRMQGYNSSRLWDVAFAMQALHSAAEAAPDVDIAGTLRSAFQYLKANQILEDPPQNQRYYRHRARGGWPFSTGNTAGQSRTALRKGSRLR